MKFFLIAAVDQAMGIGKKGVMPWHLKEDLKYFNRITRGDGHNAVIMGRATWDSIPEDNRPLKNRLNLVLSKNVDYLIPEAGKIMDSLDAALETTRKLKMKEVFVIGGARVFAQTIGHPDCAGIYLTEIQKTFGCDTFFPKIDEKKFKKVSESEVHEDKGIKFRFVKYDRVI